MGDKKYLMEIQEAFDDYNTNLIIRNARLYNNEEKKMLNLNLEDIINTEHLTYSSNHELFENPFLLNKQMQGDHTSSEDEEILEKYHQIIFYNKEKEINLNYEKHKTNSDEISDINPVLRISDSRKSKMNGNYKQSKQRETIKFVERHNSFILPRTGSKG